MSAPVTENFQPKHTTKGASMPTERSPKNRSNPTGLFATLATSLRAKGRGTSAGRRAPSLARKAHLAAALLAAATALLVAAPAQAETFGLHEFDATFTGPPPPGVEFEAAGEAGEPQLQAGSHPFAYNTSFKVNLSEAGLPAAPVRELRIDQVPGLAGIPSAVPTCSTLDFLDHTGITEPEQANCSNGSVVGLTTVEVGGEGPSGEVLGAEPRTAPVYNLAPPPGVAAKLGFYILGVPVTVNVGVSEQPPYEILASVSKVSQVLEFYGSSFTIWGVPASPAHDSLRGSCVNFEGHSTGTCPAGTGELPFLITPRACRGPLPTFWEADSWRDPASWVDNRPAGTLTHEGAEPKGFANCGALAFSPEISAQPTSRAATSPTGLDFHLDVADEGLASPKGIAGSDIERVEVTLPEGMSVNPSEAEGLTTCSEAQLAAETPFSAPGEGPTFTPPGAGCPEASKIGTIEVETPLLPGALLKGAIYIATPYQNELGSLLALYIVIKDPALGIIVRQPARVEPDPQTGQLVTTTEDMPQLPFSHFRLHFKEGARSPLVSPPACGTYQVKAVLTPWSGGAPVTSTSSFEVISGPDNSPCPTGGRPPFHPQLTAGTLNNAAGRFSPFNLKITRSDSEQEITHFSIKLPPGVAGKLAGIPFCSDAQIAQATSRTGPHGGQEELNDPSCPAASQVGRTLAGAGVGPSLAYAPGKVYLAGPYHGSPISFVSITSGVVGPFDIGTVVVRLALQVNPETGEVFLDSTGSDPIPHIVKGIPLHVRDIRAYTDRPEFTFNPTSCEETSTSSTVLGAGLDFVSPADDNPFVSTSRFQAADCAALPFKPKLTLQLVGQKKRAGNPALHAHLAMAGMSSTGANEAGLAYSQVTLPKTLFLDNAHIGTVCTRVQFKEGAVEGEKCPAGSVIGTAKAVTPILSEPLEGPIYLRSNPERELPDIAAALQGQEIHVTAVAHTDSGKGGGLRSTFEVIPDAPITSVDVNLFGGRRGLIESSRNLCSYKPKATVKFRGHNGKAQNSKDPLKVPGCHHKKHHKRHAGHARHR